MHRPCVYHVEDNDADHRLLALAFELQNVPFDLRVARDGERAIELLSECRSGEDGYPDLIILDLNLPKRSGIEVLAAIREQPSLHTVPLIVLTSSDSPSDRFDTEALGITDYLLKPMGLDGFLALGSQLLSIAANSSERAQSNRNTRKASGAAADFPDE